jgi:hypothetical protein
MKLISKNSKTFKLFKALYNGEKISAAEAQKRFGIMNIRAEATRIRNSGYAVYSKRRVAGNHVTVTEYTLGKPSRKVVAAGYRAIRLGLVD